MDNIVNSGDGKHVVVQNGQRVTAPLESKEAAEAEALRRNKVVESNGQPLADSKRAHVKQNLMG